MTHHDGELPRGVADLERLPGIGPYTARAVAALAYGQRVGAVDTNVRRVLGRSIVGDASAWDDGPRPALAARELQALADASVPTGRPGDWTHALMDIGAQLCRPRVPRCGDCPARPWCRTAALRPGEPAGGPGEDRGPRRSRAARRTREATAPFRTTSRWLRGRILDRLRDGEDGDWIQLDGGIGDHAAEAVEAALAALEQEGLAERHPSEPGLARLPLA